MIKLASRAQALKPSPTLALAAKAKELAAQGHDVISLSVGEPDWDTYGEVKEAAVRALQAGQTKYSPSNGTPELRAEIAKRTSRETGQMYSANDVVVTAGGKMAIFSALQVLCEAGDEVLIPAPYWVSYPTMVELAAATPVIIPSLESHRFKVKAVDLEACITNKSKIFILNSPSNPTGEVYSAQELSELAEVLRRHPNLVIMSDDIYNRLTLSGDLLAPHLLHVAPDLKDRMILINGASKTFSMTGWRLGWAVGPKEVIQATTNHLSQSVSCAAPFTQAATLVALQDCDSEVEKSVKTLRQRAEEAFVLLKQVPGFRVTKPGGAFYFWPAIKDCLGKSWNAKVISGSREFAEALLESERVAAVPGVEFGMEGYLRLSFVVAPARFAEAVNRIQRFVRQLK